MDISKSQWANYLPPERILDSNRMFYGKYFFRAELFVPSSHLMGSIKDKTYEEFEAQVETIRNRNDRLYGTSQWAININRDRDLMSARQMYDIYHSCQRFKGQITTRAEGRKFRIFTKTANDLLDILDYCEKTSKDSIRSIHQPASSQAIALLSDNTIFVKNPKHKYRVTIREGSYDPKLKQQILNYTNNFESQIFMSQGFKDQLSKSSTRWMTGYFQVDDLEVLTFLRLIAPRFINKIYKLEQAI